MNKNKIKFVLGHRALLIESKPKTLVITDLHIGIEYELYKSGIKIPSQTNKIKDKILELIKKTNSERLVILGDLKHKVPGKSFQEIKEIPKMLKDLTKSVEVVICKGNHDDRLEEFIPDKVKTYGSKGFIEKEIGFNHGHTWPKKEILKADTIILGHNHPLVELRDKLGYRMIEPCWVKTKMKEKQLKERYDVNELGKLNTIIMPAFNELVGGVIFNSEKELLGPLLRNKVIKLEDSELYLLNGTLLGKIKNLRKFAR